MVDMAALQACAFLDANGATEKDLAEVAARSQRNAQSNPNAIRKGNVTADDVLKQPVTHHPLRDADIFPITDGSAAIVIAAGDLARKVSKRPAWIRGIEHRIEAHGLGVRDLTHSESTRAAGVGAGVANGNVDVAELHAQFSHEELILAEALGLDAANDRDQPVGRRAGGERGHVGRARPHRRSRATHHERRRRSRRRPRDQRSVPATEHGRRPGR